MIRENSTKIGRVLFCFLLLRARVVFLFVLLRLGWGGGWSVGRDRPATNQSVALFKWPSTAGDVIAKDAGWPDRGARSRRAPMAAAGWRWGRRLGLGRWRWLALSRSPAGVPNGRSCFARSSAVSPRTVRTVRRRHRLVNGQVTCYRSRSTRFSRRHHRRTVSLAVSGRPTVALSLQCLSLLVPVLAARVVGQRRLSAVIDAAARFTGVALVHLRRFFSSPSFPLRTAAAAAAASFSAGRRPDQDGG